MFLFEWQVDLIRDANDARVRLGELATLEHGLHQSCKAFFRGIELVDLVDDHHVVHLLLVIQLFQVFFCLVFLSSWANLATESFGNEQGHLLIVKLGSTQSVHLLVSFALSHVLKQTKREAPHVCEGHSVIHVQLEFISLVLARQVPEGAQDLV